MTASRCAILLLCLVGFVCEAQESREPQSFALVIGVGDHRDRDFEGLAFAASDAIAIGEGLGAYGYTVTTLADRNATREEIFRAASALRERVRPLDRMVVYFAGHAIASPWAKEPYLVTYDTEWAYPEARGIRLGELMDLFGGLEGLQILYMLDHTFLLVDAKGAELDLKAAYYMYDELTYNWFERNRATRSVLVLAALTAQRPLLLDRPRGAFAAAVLEALGSTVADGNRDGRLAAIELVDFTRYEAASLASQSSPSTAIDLGVYGSGWIDEFTVVDLESFTTPRLVAELEFASKQRELHQQTLQRLADMKAISLRTRLFTQALLDRWVDSAETDVPLSNDEASALDEVLYILGSSYGDFEKAEMLENFQNYVQQPLQAPGNLSIK